jgi:16S rRNA (guanine527-N7)-methyltransferase
VDGYLERWLEELLVTPGITGVDDRETARRVLLDDALRATPLLERFPGAVIDVGSGGGTPGIPLAAVLPERFFTLLEAERRKCDFLERVTTSLDNVAVVWGRAEEQTPDTYGIALAKALAKPPVAVEFCLPLVAPGGVAILWLGASADRDAVAAVSAQLNGRLEEDLDGLAVLRKLGPTPAGFPRRPGIAKKRPLA